MIDEEGKLTDEDINIHATVLATQMGFTFLSGDYIAGTALIVGHDGEGETVSLNEGQKAKIKGILLGAEIETDKISAEAGKTVESPGLFSACD